MTARARLKVWGVEGTGRARFARRSSCLQLWGPLRPSNFPKAPAVACRKGARQSVGQTGATIVPNKPRGSWACENKQHQGSNACLSRKDGTRYPYGCVAPCSHWHSVCIHGLDLWSSSMLTQLKLDPWPQWTLKQWLSYVMVQHCCQYSSWDFRVLKNNLRSVQCNHPVETNVVLIIFLKLSRLPMPHVVGVKILSCFRCATFQLPNCARLEKGWTCLSQGGKGFHGTSFDGSFSAAILVDSRNVFGTCLSRSWVWKRIPNNLRQISVDAENPGWIRIDGRGSSHILHLRTSWCLDLGTSSGGPLAFSHPEGRDESRPTEQYAALCRRTGLKADVCNVYCATFSSSRQACRVSKATTWTRQPGAETGCHLGAEQRYTALVLKLTQ